MDSGYLLKSHEETGEQGHESKQDFYCSPFFICLCVWWLLCLKGLPTDFSEM